MKTPMTLVLVLLATCLAAGDAWSPVWSMGAMRTDHTATLLPGSQVLVAGGHTGSQSTNTCEIYDLATGTWRSTGSMTVARRNFAALLLASGRVLAVGGNDSGADCELYDLQTGVWTAGGDMAVLRRYPVLVPLADGRVLAAGGFVQAGYASTNTCEIYDPTTGLWSTTGAMNQARTQHIATLLPDGRVFVAGGHTGFDYGTALATCEIFNPATGIWSTAATMAQPRTTHTATLLDDGRVLLAGGMTLWNLSSEIFNPATNLLTTTAGVSTRRDGAVSALLPDGRVLLTAGGTLSSTSEVWNPANGTWTTATMGTKRTGHTATVLPSGQVLVLGGIPDGTGAILASGEVFTPGGGTRTATTSPGTYYDTGTVLLSSGKVLAHDGFNCKEYDPTTGTWLPTANGFLYARAGGPALSLLPSGKVLCVGGLSSGSEWPRAELYDPATRTWGLTTPLPANPGGVVAVPLLSGQVLVVGGSSCLIYDPVTAGWTTTGTMIAARSDHRAALLPDGRVLVTGGTVSNGYSGATEIYSPVTGTWTAGPNMITPRYGHALIALANGRIMAVGGTPTGYSGCEFFDNASGMWLPGPTSLLRRYNPSLITLPSGRLLATVGTNVSTDLPELFDIQTGVWLAGEGLAGTGQDRARAVLPSGAVLVGGRNTSGTAAWSTWLQPTSPARQPVVSEAIADATGVTVTGSGFLPSHEGVEPSPSNRPIVSWQRSQDGRMWWLAADGPLSDTQARCALPADATGPGWLRVYVNGIASAAVFLRIDPPTASLSTSATIISENGGTATLTVTISRRFALPITAILAVEGGTASTGDYVLTSTTVTIPSGSLSASTALTGVADALIETGGETVVVGIASVANGAEAGVQQATVTLTDYQSPGFAVSAISRHTTEAGQTATFTVQPSSPPLASVTLNIASTDSTEGVVSSGSSLVFTTGNWTTAQTVTVTGVDDAIDDGNIAYSILGSASSSDPDYDNRAMPAIAVVNDDDDSAGITIAAPVGFITEGGGSATLGVSLASQPTSNVTVAIASGATAQGTVAPASLSFTTANWNIPQTVTVTGANGDNADNPEAGTSFNLSATVTAGPGEYPTSITASRTLVCYPSNAAPAIAAVTAQSVTEDSTVNAVPLAGIGAGGGTESQTLTITATSSDPAILPDPVVTYTSPGATGSLNLAPVANATGSVTVTVRVTDDATIGRAGAKDAARSTEIAFVVTVTPLNDAPVVSGTTATPWSQAEDDAAAPGTLVGAILGGLTISDADAGALRGLAITAADSAHGTWQFNSGTGWNAIGAVAAGTARLLADDGVSKLRFVPAADYNGSAVLTFRAWDRSSGTNGGMGDATTTGGTTAFSATAATATVTVTPVNDAPVLAGTTGNPLTTVVGGQANPGTPVAALIATLVSDLDVDAQGIAVVGVSGAGGGGAWQYSTDSGATWGSLAGAGASTARLLSDAGSMLVRYAPQANEAGTASLVFRAWDRTSGTAGGNADIATLGTGGTTAFSVLAATSMVAVTSGNAAPVVSLPTALLSYTENQSATPLDPAATISDLDSADFAGGTMTVECILGASSADRLEVQATGGVTISSGTVSVDGTAVAVAAGGTGATPLTLSWNAAATPALAQRVLRAVSFRNASEDPSTAVRIVRVATSDGDGATSFPTTVTVTVAAVNDAPALSLAASAGTWTEDQPALLLDAAASLSDPDSPAFASGTFSATLHAGGEASDVLAIRSQGAGAGQIAVAGGEVSYGGTVFGTVSGGSGPGTPLVVLLDADASQAAVQALMRNLTYVSTSQHPSAAARTVRLRLTDGGGGISPDANVQVAVQPVNDAPNATTSPWQVNPGSLNAISAAYLAISDVDEPEAETLVATITALPGSGSVIINGVTAGVGSSFTWRNLLDTNVRYQAPGSSGSYSLGFTIGDGTVSGIGPFSLLITVTDSISNLPPVLELGGTASWQENLPPVAVDPNAEITDADSPVLSGGALTAAVTLGGTGAERLSISDSGGVTVNGGAVAVNGVVVGTVTGGSGASPLNVALNAAATPERVTRVARAISFAVEAAAPGTAERRVTVQVSDGTSASEAKNALVQVVEVNSPPVVTLPRVATATIEGAGATILDPGATCGDADSLDFDGGQVVVSLVSGGDGADLLGLSRVGDITIVDDKIQHAGAEIGTWSGGGDAPITVLLNSQATDAKVADLLRCVTLENSSEDPVAGTRVVRFSVSDGEGGTGTAELGVYVAGINDAPTVSISGGAVVWRQGDPPTRIDDAATVGDVDSGNFAGGRLTASLSSGASATDQLTITDHGPITVAAGTVAWSGTTIGTVTGGDNGTAPLIVNLAAAATPARVKDLLRALAFSGTAAVPTTQDRTVAVTVEDGDGGTSTLRSRVVQVQQVNLPPVVTLSGGAAAYTEDAAAVALDAGASVSDPESDVAGGVLTIIPEGADDRLTIPDQGVAAGQIGVTGAQVTWGGTPLGTVSGGIGTALTINLAQTATPAGVRDLLRAVRYASVAQNPPSSRSIGVTLNDGDGGTSPLATRSVAITPVNDAPEATPTVLAVLGQTASGTWTASDAEGDPLTWTVTVQPGNGSLSVDAALGTWTFTPSSGGSSTATVHLSDGGDTTVLSVPVAVSAPTDPRPVVISDPPLSVQIGQTWTWELRLAATDLAAQPDLEIEAIGAPAGLTIANIAGHAATLSWAVPAGSTAGSHAWFTVRISDRVSGRSCLQPVLIHLRAPIAGGG